MESFEPGIKDCSINSVERRFNSFNFTSLSEVSEWRAFKGGRGKNSDIAKLLTLRFDFSQLEFAGCRAARIVRLHQNG